MKNSRPVYSTDTGRLCPQCGLAQHKGRCKSGNSSPTPASGKHEGFVLLRRETKGRKGAGVTIVENTGLSNDALKTLAKDLKKKCGVGGAIKQGLIEIQGDQRDTVAAELEKRGMKVKRVGG
jgi:translation initiation factor 1